MKTKIFIIAEVPAGLEQAWLQHVRDFDVAHPGCHFETGVDVPDKSITEITEMMRVNPGLSFTKYFKREKP